MMRIVLAERSFTFADQELFARLSGDRNPVHLDPVSARRSLAKQPIAHGVHALLWALQSLCAQMADLPPIGAMRVRFEKMIPVGANVRAVFARDAKGGGRLDVVVDDASALVCLLTFGEPVAQAPVEADSPAALLDAPLAARLAEMASLRGRAPLACSTEEARERFPAACRALGAARVAGLMGCSYIVGMICPGLYSIFRGLKLTAAEPAEPTSLGYQAAAVDERFRLVRLDVEGAGWVGSLEAHVAPEPVAQPSMALIARRIVPGEFKGVRALVIGGSRGLGELIVKIVAAGGGEAIFTYHAGEADARRLQKEIADFGGRARFLRFDAVKDDPAALGVEEDAPNQLYPMATPAIAPGREGGFSASLFDIYLKFYVHCFHALAVRFAAQAHDGLSIFYPSTVFLDEPRPGLAEYAMAKAAGEALCADLRMRRGLEHVLVRRLPRLPTDQTMALASEMLPDSLMLLLPIVREMTARLERSEDA
jgi:hypothetical protein